LPARDVTYRFEDPVPLGPYSKRDRAYPFLAPVRIAAGEVAPERIQLQNGTVAYKVEPDRKASTPAPPATTPDAAKRSPSPPSQLTDARLSAPPLVQAQPEAPFEPLPWPKPKTSKASPIQSAQRAVAQKKSTLTKPPLITDVDRGKEEKKAEPLGTDSSRSLLPTNSEEAFALADYFYGKDWEATQFFRDLGHHMVVDEVMAVARRESQKGAELSNLGLVAMFAVPSLIVLAIEGGPLIAAIARMFPTLVDPRVQTAMAFIYGLLAPPGAPDYPGPADDLGREVKSAGAGVLGPLLARLRKRQTAETVAAFGKLVDSTLARWTKGKMQMATAEAQEVMRDLAKAATSGGLTSQGAIEKRIAELMKLATQMAKDQGFVSSLKNSANRALGNRAHAYLRFAIEALDIELRSLGPVQGVRYGVWAEMFLGKSGKKLWVFEGLMERGKSKLGLDAVLFSEGKIVKGFDLKTGRELSEGEMKPLQKVFDLGVDKIKQIFGQEP
jgi:hypothetical protein